jgi:hypothetical protein
MLSLREKIFLELLWEISVLFLVFSSYKENLFFRLFMPKDPRTTSARKDPPSRIEIILSK